MHSPITPVVYICRDIERSLGIVPSPLYRIITNSTAYSRLFKQRYPDFITLIDSETGMLDTAELMQHPVAAALISTTTSSILVFKNTKQIETIAHDHGWKLLNPSAVVAEKIENKITQIDWLGSVGEEVLPAHTVQVAKEIIWHKKPLVIQWAHGHTGDGTIVINSTQELEAIQAKFPERQARVSEFIRGPSFTANMVITPSAIVLGNTSYQITGMPPFTDNVFSTVGNDWSVTHTLLSESDIERIEALAKQIGALLQADGWLGLAGIDLMYDEELGRIVLIEINARQPASTTFESFLQNDFRLEGVPGITMFEAHILALTGQPITEAPVPINDGAQIIQRITTSIKTIDEDIISDLESSEYQLIPYTNVEHNADLLRIQSMKGIMEAHGKFNSRGKDIITSLTGETS